MPHGRVLLLEDDHALRGLLLEALAGEGFDVRPCETFPEIRGAAEAKQADLVVADFWGRSQRSLPDTELQEIRDLGSLLPVVLLTGRSWAADVSADELGAHALIRKPFDLDDLLRTVERVFAGLQA
jgi:two-component system, NtrC family, nitrogen regulation response regulator GlnG